MNFSLDGSYFFKIVNQLQMISKKEIGQKYLEALENGNIKELLKLFTKKGTVNSPVYGTLKATKFYSQLNSHTLKSQLKLKGFFEDCTLNRLAIYFNYKWTLSNNKSVEFDVVDIMEFNASNKISNLKIIYDTIKSSALVKELKK